MNKKWLSILLMSGLSLIFVACNYPAGGAPTLTSIPLPWETQVQPPEATNPAPLVDTPAALTATSPVQAPTPAVTEQPLSLSEPYAVILVDEGDLLNVRQGPGTDQPVVQTLPPQATDIRLTGKDSMIENARWVEVQLANGITGWIHAWFLTEFVPPSTFCEDPQVSALIENLGRALQQEDGELFASLVSPRHGVHLHYLRGETVANYTPEEAKFVFESDYQVNWGSHPGSGLPVKGSFRAEVLPKLRDLFDASFTRHCNDLITGGVTYVPAWPDEYRNINFYSLVKPGSAGVDLDWRTWLLGIEYVGGKPYVFALQHFFWEP